MNDPCFHCENIRIINWVQQAGYTVVHNAIIAANTAVIRLLMADERFRDMFDEVTKVHIILLASNKLQ